MKKHLLLAFSFAFILVQLTSCDKTTDPIVPAKKYLVSATLYKEYTKESLISSFGSQGSLLAAFVNSGIKQYKIVYKTTNTDGKEIEASGAFMMPSNSTAIMPLLSLQHGTITKDTDAPSYFSTTGEAQIGSFLLRWAIWLLCQITLAMALQMHCRTRMSIAMGLLRQV